MASPYFDPSAWQNEDEHSEDEETPLNTHDSDDESVQVPYMKGESVLCLLYILAL